MFCKNCGKEIADDSKFCNFCGKEQQTATDIPENNLSIGDEQVEKMPWGLVLGGLIVVVFLIFAFVVALNATNSEKNNSSSISAQETTRSARKSDLVVSFKKMDNFFEHDDYYMVIQAQEKISNLQLSIDYQTSSGKVVKTKVVYVGKVVPGNEYKFELDQSGIDWDYLDKVSKFSYSIVSGTVEE